MTNEQPGTGDNAPLTDPATGDSNLSTDDITVSLSEAAEQFGVSERTILRRIQKGALSAYKVDTPHGQAWRITLDSTPDSAPPAERVTPAKTPVTGDNPATAELMHLLEAERKERIGLVQRNEQLAGQVGFLQARVQEQERIIALLQAPLDDPAPMEEVEPRRRWWEVWKR
jgi:excisionase family DNA binding protein